MVNLVLIFDIYTVKRVLDEHGLVSGHLLLIESDTVHPN